MLTLTSIGLFSVGLVLLLGGIKLYRTLVALAGFAIGVGVGYPVLLTSGFQNDTAVGGAFVIGVLAAGVLLVVQRFIIQLPGIVLGGAIGFLLGSELINEFAGLVLAIFAAGIGAKIALQLFDPIVAALSSLLGAAFIVYPLYDLQIQAIAETRSFDPIISETMAFVFAGLVVFGIVFQLGLVRLTGDETQIPDELGENI